MTKLTNGPKNQNMNENFQLNWSHRSIRWVCAVRLDESQINLNLSIQEGVVDPPSVSSISRLLRGGGMERKDDRKDYSIHGILGGEFHKMYSMKITLSWRRNVIAQCQCLPVEFCLVMSTKLIWKQKRRKERKLTTYTSFNSIRHLGIPPANGKERNEKEFKNSMQIATHNPRTRWVGSGERFPAWRGTKDRIVDIFLRSNRSSSWTRIESDSSHDNSIFHLIDSHTQRIKTVACKFFRASLRASLRTYVLSPVRFASEEFAYVRVEKINHIPLMCSWMDSLNSNIRAVLLKVFRAAGIKGQLRLFCVPLCTFLPAFCKLSLIPTTCLVQFRMR